MLYRRLRIILLACVSALALHVESARADERLPVPTAVELVNAEGQIKELYKEELGHIRPAERVALAKTLLQQVEGVKSDMAARYEIFLYARTLAAKGGDIPTAMEAADRLCKEFQVRPGQAHAVILELAPAIPTTPEAAREACEAYLGAADGAVAADEYDAALTLAKAAEAAGRRTQTLTSALAAQQRIKWINAIKPEAEKVKPSIDALAKNPTDPAANLAVGRFYCFVKNDWERGLGYLALGSDVGLKETSLRDMMAAKSSTATEKLLVADAWFNIATTADPIAKSFIQMHAYALYTDSIPGLSGLEKTKAEHRVAELQKVVDAHTDNSKLWSMIRKAATSKSVRKWDFIGGAFSREEFDEIPPNGALLIGFNFTSISRGQYPGVVQAIYLTPSGEVLGRIFGKPEKGARMGTTKAKPGYAVAAIYVRGGGGFDAFQPIYMRIGSDGFKTEDKYDGPYVGGQGGGEGIVGDGNFIIGLHCKVRDDGAVMSLSIATLTTATHTVRLTRVAAPTFVR